MASRAGRSGFSLAEVLVSVVLVGTIGITLFELLSCGARTASVASEHQLATMLASRTMDQLLSFGYQALNQSAGVDEEIDLSSIGQPAEEGAQPPDKLEADGFTYSGRYSVEKVSPSLLRLSVKLSWQRKSADKQGGSLSVSRYVANPAACVSVRESFGGGQA